MSPVIKLYAKNFIAFNNTHIQTYFLIWKYVIVKLRTRFCKQLAREIIQNIDGYWSFTWHDDTFFGHHAK